MDINPAEIQKMTKEYEKALSSGANADIWERLITAEENQLEFFDCLLRVNRNGRTVTYLKNLTFRALNILSAKVGRNSYIPSVRTPEPCSSPLSRAINVQLDIFILLDKTEEPFPAVAELSSIENRKLALINTMRN